MRHRWLIVLAIAVGIGLRFGAGVRPGMIHPDEVIQYLEQAHRLVFGDGIVPWEYRYGMRSWLFPLLLSVPMRLGEVLVPGGTAYLWLPKLAVAIVSAGIIPAAWVLGSRLGRAHALVAMLVAVVWYEFVHLGGHALTESMAVALILPAAAILSSGQPTRDGRRARFVLAGLLLGLAVVMRFHYGPAIAVLVLLSCGRDVTGRWLPVIGGGAIALAAGAAVDVAMGQPPFGWLFANVHQNLTVGRSAAFGVSGPLAYFADMRVALGVALIPVFAFIVPAIVSGAARYRPLFWMAVVNLGVHMLIGHKEYRFIALSMTAFVLLAAIGSVECARLLALRAPPRVARRRPGAVALLWVASSAALATGSAMKPRWEAYRPEFETIAAAGRIPKSCGVALSGLNVFAGGGYVHLHRPVPIYLVNMPGDDRSTDIAQVSRAFDVIVASDAMPTVFPPQYRRLSCRTQGNHRRYGLDPPGRVCLYVRPGPCAAQAAQAHRVEAVMRRHDW